MQAVGPSPVEESRSVVSNATGRYLFVDLAPGRYVVTFRLPGFGTITHDGVDLSGAYTVTINAEMKLLPIEPTITVTGPSPVDDLAPFILLIDAYRPLRGSRS